MVDEGDLDLATSDRVPEELVDFDVRVWSDGSVVVYLGTENPDVFFAGMTVEQAEKLAQDLQTTAKKASRREGSGEEQRRQSDRLQP